MLEKYLPNNLDWEIIEARREHRKGRAKGGFLIGIKKNWNDKEGYTGIEITEGLIKSKIVVEKDELHLNIWSVYNSSNLEKIWQCIEEDSFEDRNGTIVAGDFNIRIGVEGKCMDYEFPGEIRNRKTKDKLLGKGGRDLVEKIENKGWIILNGTTAGDEEGEYTFIGSRGNSVIDYAITNEEAWKTINYFRVEERVESDHLPISIELKADGKFTEGTEDTNEGDLNKIIEVWNEESIAVFREETNVLNIVENKADTIEKRWKDTKESINKTVPRKEIKCKKWKLGMRRWWDKDCSRSKRKAKNLYKLWKKGKALKEDYTNARRIWKETCEEKKRSKKEEDEAELKEIKNEVEVWKYLNKGRKKREARENKIKKEVWVEHFRTLLEGSEEKSLGSKRELPTEKEEERINVTEITAA